MKQKILNILILSIILSAYLIRINGDVILGDVILGDELKKRTQLFHDVFQLKENVDRLKLAIEDLNKSYFNQINIFNDIQTRQTKLEQISQDQMKILQEINAKLTKTQEKVENMEKDLPTIKEYIRVINQVVNKKPPRLPMEVILGLKNATETKLK